MSQQIQIALDPELEIDPQAFVAAWNEEAETSRYGELKTAPATAASYVDPDMLIILLEVSISIASGVLSNLLTDIVKKKSQQPEIIEIHQPDGQKIIVVRKP